MSDITINVGVDETMLINAGIGLPTHSVTHISGGSDEINHNLLIGLQGGSSSEYYHISSGQYFNLTTGDVVRPSETGQFYLNSNPSGFITGVDLSSYTTVSYVSTISGNLQTQITDLNNSTGSYVLNSETGQFYSSLNPSGYITGINLSSYATTDYVTGVSGSLQNQISNLNNQTGSYVFKAETGNFMTAGFYKKQEETLLYAPNTVEGDGYVLIAQHKDQYEYPVDGWFWFENEEEAYIQFQITPPIIEEVTIE